MIKEAMVFNDLCLKYLQYPSGKTPSPGGTLILFLHGRAANEVDLFDLAPQLDGKYTILSVRAPITMGADSYGWFYTTYPPSGAPIYDRDEVERARMLLIQFIKEAQEKYHVTPQHTYLMGFSQGSIIAMSVALHFPELIAGVVAMSGRILPEHLPATADPRRLKDFPILLSHGTEDEVLSVEYARSAKHSLEQLPVQLSYYEYPMGHDVTDLNFKDVQKWFSER